jgi:hypothetical protein
VSEGVCRAGSTVLVLLAAGSLLGAPAARGDQGVSIDVGRVAVTEDLLAGGSYRLPTFGVTNPGSTRAAYRLAVSYVEGQRADRPPHEWFRFSPETLTLRPHQTRPVQVRLSLPTDAEPGDYAALIGAQLAPEGGGTQVGAAAAARLTFTVAPSGLLEAWWLRAKTLYGDSKPWSYLFPALALAFLGLRQLRRRVTITVARRV